MTCKNSLIRSLKYLKLKIKSLYQIILQKMKRESLPKQFLIFNQLEKLKANSILTTYVR